MSFPLVIFKANKTNNPILNDLNWDFPQAVDIDILYVEKKSESEQYLQILWIFFYNFHIYSVLPLQVKTATPLIKYLEGNSILADKKKIIIAIG